jgi:hypothetical protein
MDIRNFSPVDFFHGALIALSPQNEQFLLKNGKPSFKHLPASAPRQQQQQHSDCLSFVSIARVNTKMPSNFLSIGTEGHTLMVEENHVTQGDLLLQDSDFPENYVRMAHPEDYKPTEAPLPVTCLLHQKIGHWRLILRVSFRLTDGKYLPMSFVCDTGAPYDFYFSDRAIQDLTTGGRLKEDDIGNAYLDNVVGRKAAVRETPYTHKPANILGLKMMLKLGIKLTETGFAFSEPFASF